MRFSHSITLVLLAGLLPLNIFAQQNFDLIPKPASLTLAVGTYHIPTHPKIFVSQDFVSASQLLAEHPAIASLTTEIVKKIKKAPKEGIRILKAEDSDKLDKSAYRIAISEKGIVVLANEVAPVINAIYTLVQLGYLQDDPTQIAALDIEDKPTFSYRGLHLDPSRHFIPFNIMKKFVDIMAIYKFNNLHWHLTDGAGWRLEIKQYPELTKKAAWRTHVKWKDWWNNGRQYVDAGTPNASGGFYTQEQARELVEYAAKKGINIIPEIEMPGHSEEVLAIYPELSCSGKPYTQSEFCIGNEKTFEFLKNVLDEVIAIFPSPYIHIGGDEADKKHWKTCPKCQALKTKEGLKSEEELQSYLIKQIDEYVQSKGRKIIGWDEILEGGLTKGATVMSWRGESGGINSANAGHDVIMTPGSHLYFDSYQTDPRTQPETIGGYLPISKVYEYNPIPSGIQEDKIKHVLGAQGNLWAEYMPNYFQLEYMAFPRALALSEVVWTKSDLKNWPNFHKRLQSHYKILQHFDINYYRPSYNVKGTVVFDEKKGSNNVTLSTEQLHASNIRYTIDGSKPTYQATPYNNSFDLSVPAIIKAAYFLDSTQVGPIETIQLDVHKAIGKTVTYNNKWSDGYPAQQELTLTNGIKGGLTYQDGQWQGFLKDLDVVVDFERREEISSVAMNFMQITGPGVYMPGEFKVLLSENGRTFREVGIVQNDVSDQDPTLTFKRFELKLAKPQHARYVRVVATNPKKGFLFADELIVY